MPSRFARLAVVTRNDLEESWHLGAVAVVDGAGRLVARAGDPSLETFVRSAAKPWQALPLLAAAGRERFLLDDSDLARGSRRPRDGRLGRDLGVPRVRKSGALRE